MPTAGPDDATIREQAYYFWEEEGRPAGRETEFWMRAVTALTEKSQLDTLTEAAPKKPKTKAAASKAKAAPAKSGAAGKPKKK